MYISFIPSQLLLSTGTVLGAGAMNKINTRGVLFFQSLNL